MQLPLFLGLVFISTTVSSDPSHSDYLQHVKEITHSAIRSVARLSSRGGAVSCCSLNKINSAKLDGDDKNTERNGDDQHEDFNYYNMKIYNQASPFHAGTSGRFRHKNFEPLFFASDSKYMARRQKRLSSYTPNIAKPGVTLKGKRYTVVSRDDPESILVDANVLSRRDHSLAIFRMHNVEKTQVVDKRPVEDILMGLWIELGGMNPTSLRRVRFDIVISDPELNLIKSIYQIKGKDPRLDQIIIHRWAVDDKTMFKKLFNCKFGRTVDKLNGLYTGKVIDAFILTPWAKLVVRLGFPINLSYPASAANSDSDTDEDSP